MAKPIVVEVVGETAKFVSSMKLADTTLAGFAKTSTLAAGALAVGLGTALFQVGKSFDSAYDTIITGTGASGEILEGLQEDFKAVFASVPTDAEQAGIAIADLNTRLGLTGDPLQDMSRRFLELSRITGSDVSTSIENVSRVFGDWGIQTEDQALALDKIFEATKRTGITVDELTTKTVQFGAPLRQLGFTFEESLALFGKWNKEGVNTETILGGVRQAIGRFAKDGKNVEESFAAAVKQITEVEDSSVATALAIEAFGQRAGPDMAAAIREGRFELGEMVGGLMGADGALLDAADRTQSFSEKWNIFKNKVLIAIEPLATKFFTAMGDGMGRISENSGPVIEQAKEMGERFKSDIMPVVKGLAEKWFPKFRDAIDDVVSILREATRFVREHEEVMIGIAAAIGVFVVAAFLSWAVAAGAAAIATLAAASPVIVLGIAIAALVALFVKAYRENERFRNMVDSTVVFLKRMWETTKALASVIAENFVPGLEVLRDKVNHWVADFKRGLDTIASKFRSFQTNLRSGVTFIKTILERTYDHLTKPFRDGFNWIKDKWEELKSLLSGGISIPNPFGGLGSVFGRQFGGPIANSGIFKVGERGPETVVLPRGANVLPAHQTSTSSSGGNTFNINNNADPHAIERALAWQMRMA